jgi:hypothetical protein
MINRRFVGSEFINSALRGLLLKELKNYGAEKRRVWAECGRGGLCHFSSSSRGIAEWNCRRFSMETGRKREVIFNRLMKCLLPFYKSQAGDNSDQHLFSDHLESVLEIFLDLIK